MGKRFEVSKAASASKFRGQVSQTKKVNLPRQVMRGGWRL